MIQLTYFDNSRKVLINTKSLIMIEDVGSYRIVLFRTTEGNCSKFYVIESIEDISMLL
jgi:hypothetical protein